MSAPTIKQRTITIPLEESRSVAVRRMKWKAAREFLLKLSGHLAGVQKLTDIVANLPQLIAGADELVKHLVLHSTDLTETQVDDLDLLQLAEIVAAALELNTGAELKNCFAGIAKNVGALMPAAMPMSSTASSTPTS